MSKTVLKKVAKRKIKKENEDKSIKKSAKGEQNSNI